MKRIYYLSTCDTCRKILNQVNTDGVELINLREQNISREDLDFMKKRSKSYEALFNKRAQKLKEYTFLKRPSTILDDKIIFGNDKKAVETLLQALPK